VFIVEQQYNAGGVKGKGQSNNKALLIAETVFMWLLDRYPMKKIEYFPAKYKTQIPCALRMRKKVDRKKWSVVKAREYHTLRNDEDMISVYNLKDAVSKKRITTNERVEAFMDDYPTTTEDAIELAYKVILDKQKLDDVSDVFMDLQAYKFKELVAMF
jgi:hypothetical protein